ncbi:MAG: c-type cytochrome [Nitrospirota bacterium]
MRRPHQLGNLVIFVTTLGGLAVPSPVMAAGDAARGKTIYEKNCLGCHGRTGHGVGGATPNLADPDRMSALTDQHLYQTVTQGRPGTGMPSWSTVLSDQDRWHVVAYVRTLSAR